MQGFFFLTATSGWGQGLETFDNLDEPGSTYVDGTFEGQDGSTWTYVQCRGDYEITGTAIMIGRNRTPQSNFYSGTISGGIGILNFNYKQAFGTNVDLEVYVNDELVGSVTTSGEQGVVKNSGEIQVNVEGDFVIKFINRINGAGQVVVDDIEWTGYVDEDQVATPSFNPGAGTYYAPFDVEITTVTDDAIIKYSFDSDEGPWNVYDDGNRPTISETTTIWAYAEKGGMDDSNVASAEYTLPIEVASIEALQGIAEENVLYRITGEVFMTYQNDSRNQKYFQDNLTGGRGIKIDDDPGHLTTELEIGDGVIDLLGTINVLNRMIRFRPIEGQSPEAAHSTGNTLTPLPVTLADMIDENNIITVAGQEISVYQSLLIEIEDLQFEQDGDFDSGTNFGEVPISDPTASLGDIDAADFGVLFRVEYSDLEYNNDPIPQVPLTLTAIVDQRFSNARIFARDWDDFEIEDPILFASPSSLDGFTYVEGEGPSEEQQFTVSGQNLLDDITINAPDNYEISETSGSGYTDEIVLSQTDGEVAETEIFVILKSGLEVGTYNENIEIASEDADMREVSLEGEVTEPLVTEVPFETKFGIDENWWADGSMGSYNEKSYTEGGWFFHSSSAIRGTGDETYDDSPYSFRDTGGFTIKNLAVIDGMTGFSMQLRNWMGTAANPANTERDIEVSLDGGDTWEIVLTLNQEWFDEFQVYQEFVYYFSEEQNLDAEELQIIISGGSAGSGSHRINIGQFKALDEEPPPPPAVPGPEFDLAADLFRRPNRFHR